MSAAFLADARIGETVWLAPGAQDAYSGAVAVLPAQVTVCQLTWSADGRTFALVTTPGGYRWLDASAPLMVVASARPVARRRAA